MSNAMNHLLMKLNEWFQHPETGKRCVGVKYCESPYFDYTIFHKHNFQTYRIDGVFIWFREGNKEYRERFIYPFIIQTDIIDV